MSSVAYPVLQQFLTLSNKHHTSGKKNLLIIKCVLIFSTTFVWNISHSKKKWARYEQKCMLVFMYRLCLSDFNENWIFSTDFRKKKYSNIKFSWKSVQWEPSCFMRRDGRTDGQTRHDELIVALRSFMDAPTNQSVNTVQGNNPLFVLRAIRNLNTQCGQNVKFFWMLKRVVHKNNRGFYGFHI